jgi:uncharacterized protein
MSDKIEYRAVERPLDHTAEGFGGVGALYYDGTPATEAKIAPDLVERFMPGAFRESYSSGADVLSMYDHDRNIILGRRSNGMKLTEDERGLSYWIPLDRNDPDHVRVHAKISRGDVRGSSITFATRSNGQKFVKGSGPYAGMYIREIHAANVLEIGPTPMPVYRNATAEARAEQRSATIAELLTAAKAQCIEPPDASEFELLLLS